MKRVSDSYDGLDPCFARTMKFERSRKSEGGTKEERRERRHAKCSRQMKGHDNKDTLGIETYDHCISNEKTAP